MLKNQKRPAGNGANPESHADGTAYILTAPELVAWVDHVNGAYAVVTEVHPDRYRRRVFLSLSAAEKHVRRARERGQSAKIVLAELKPLYVVAGTAQASLDGGEVR